MANYIATTEQFTATADAIRAKTGSSISLEWDASTGYADDIAAISTGTDTSDATAAAADILSGKTAYVNGSKVTGTIATKTASNLSASGKTVTVPAGYYASQVTKDVASGSATAPSSISGSSATVSTGTNTLTLTKTVSVTPSVSAGYVSAGTAGNSSVSLTASVTTKAAATLYPSSSDQTISSGQYLTGAQTIKAVKLTNLTAANIKSGVTVQVGDASSAGGIASVTGIYEGIDTTNIVSYGVSWVQGKYLKTNGSVASSSNFKYTSTYIPVKPSTTYTLSANIPAGSTSSINVTKYNETTFLSTTTLSGGGSFTTESNCTAIRLSVGTSVKQIKIT